MCNTCRKWAQEPELNLEMEADIFFATSTGGWTQWTSKSWPQLLFNSCIFSWSQGWSQWAKWHGSPTRRELLTLLLSELLQEFHHRASKRLQNVSLGTNPNGAASSLAGACWMPPHPRSCPKPTPEARWTLNYHLTYLYLSYHCLILSYCLGNPPSTLIETGRSSVARLSSPRALSAGKDASACRTSEDAKRPRQTSLEAPEWIFTAWARPLFKHGTARWWTISDSVWVLRRSLFTIGPQVVS